MRGKISDRDHLIIISVIRSYYYLKGDFTARMILDFLMTHKFGIKKHLSYKGLNLIIKKSSLFRVSKKNKDVVYYEVI